MAWLGSRRWLAQPYVEAFVETIPYGSGHKPQTGLARVLAGREGACTVEKSLREGR